MPRATEFTPDSDAIVDDAELEVFHYGGLAGPWYHMNDTVGPNYHKTASECYQRDSTVAFTFEGVQVAAYGYVPPLPPNTTGPTTLYSVDEAEPTNYTPPNDYFEHYYTLFYQSDLLPFGNHTLHILVTTPGDRWYSLDWIEYNVTADRSGRASSSLPPAASSTNTSTDTTTSASSTATTVPSVPIGPIVGGALGGLLLLVAGLVLAFWLGRRRSTRRSGVIDLTREDGGGAGRHSIAYEGDYRPEKNERAPSSTAVSPGPSSIFPYAVSSRPVETNPLLQGRDSAHVAISSRNAQPSGLWAGMPSSSRPGEKSSLVHLSYVGSSTVGDQNEDMSRTHDGNYSRQGLIDETPGMQVVLVSGDEDKPGGVPPAYVP